MEKHSTEPGMNGAAIVLSDGREIPITRTMVQNTLEAMTAQTQPRQDSDSDSAPGGMATMPMRAYG